MKKTLMPFLFVVAACAGSAPPPGPMPQPAPVAAVPDPAPAPAPAPTPAPPDRKGEILAVLDDIEHQLKECEDKKMDHVDQHAGSIKDLAARLTTPIQDFPKAASAYEKLKTQAAKFIVACEHKNHKDQHEHHHELKEAVDKLRASL